MKKYIKPNIVLVLIIILYFVLALPFLSSSPSIWSDEGSFSETAWYFIDGLGEHSVFRQPLYTGYLNYENFSASPFYLYFLFLSLSFKLFGLGILQARLISFFSGFILILFFYFFVKKNFGEYCALISTSLLVCNPLFILSARIVRPEMLTTLFSFLAFIFILNRAHERRLFLLFLSGVFVVLSGLSHPNGLYISLAAFVLVLMKKQHWKDVSFYLFGIIIGSIPLVIFIFINHDLFITQFLDYSYRLPHSFTQLGLNFFHEPKRWLTGITVPFSFILGVFAFIFLALRYQKLKEYYAYLIILIGSFSFFEYHKYYGYLLLTLPFFCILSGILFMTLKRNIKSIIIPLFLLILFLYVGVVEWKIIQDTQYSYINYCQEIKQVIPETIKEEKIILGDASLWFCFPDGNLREIMTQIKIKDILGFSFKETLQWQNITYIVLDPGTQSGLFENKLIRGDPRGSFGDTNGYIEAINSCTQIAEVTEPYNRYTTTRTIIYKC